MKNYPKITALGGLALPAYKHGGGFFVRKNKFDTAWGDILLSLFTRPSGRIHQREFGCRLTDLLFAPVSEIDGQMVKYLVTETVNRFASHITVLDVLLNKHPKGIEIGVIFTLTSEKGEPITRSAVIPKTFVSNG